MISEPLAPVADINVPVPLIVATVAVLVVQLPVADAPESVYTCEVPAHILAGPEINPGFGNAPTVILCVSTCVGPQVGAPNV